MLTRVLAALGMIVTSMLVLPSSVDAHPSLQSTSPAADEVVPSGPAVVELVFNEAVNATLGGVQVIGPDGRRVDRGRPSVSDGGKVVRTAISASARGTYSVAWRVVSEDAHVLAGSLVFHVEEATGEPVAVAFGSGRVTSLLAALGRWLAFAGLLAAIGGIALGSSPASQAARRRMRGVAIVGGSVAALGALIALGGAVADASGRSFAGGVAMLPDAIGSTRLGRVGATRVAMSMLLAGAAAALPWWKGDAWVRAAVTGTAVATVVATSVSGHAWTTAPRLGAVLVDSVHLGALAVWIGGLAAFLFAAPAVEDARALARTLSRFALWAALVVFVTGSISAWWQVGSFEALSSTTYGKLLVAKVVGAVVIVCLGYVNRRALAQAADRVGSVLRTARLEVAIAVVVLGITAALVDVQPARDAVARPFFASLPSATGEVSLAVEPAKLGPNDVRLSFLTADGLPRAVDAAELLISVGDMPDRRVALRQSTPSQFSASGVFLGATGQWRFTLAAVRAGESETVTFSVPVR